MNLDRDAYSYRICPSQLVPGDVVPGVGTVDEVTVFPEHEARWVARVTWSDGASTLYSRRNVRVQCARVEAEVALMRELRATVDNFQIGTCATV